jgi:regulator of replication initiation timing
MRDLDKAVNDLDKAMRDLAKVTADLVERTERLNWRLRVLNEALGRRNRAEKTSRSAGANESADRPERRREDTGILAQVRELLDDA